MTKMTEQEQNVAMLQSEKDYYYTLIQELKEALQDIYANRGEDEFIANICNPLIEKTGDF